MADNTMIKEKVAVSKSKIVAIADAIRDKTNSSDVLTLDTMPEAISGIKGGGAATSVDTDADVVFYDYDGTPLYSYTKEEFLALDAMPDLPPDTDRLTATGWNFSLTLAKETVSNNGFLDIGCYRDTIDGKFHYILKVDEDSLAGCLRLTTRTDSTDKIIVDWGDGETSENSYAKDTVQDFRHTYKQAGRYVVKVDIQGDSVELGGEYYGNNFSGNMTYGAPYLGGNLWVQDDGKNYKYPNYSGNYNYLLCVEEVNFNKKIQLRRWCFRNNLNISKVSFPKGYETKTSEYAMQCNFPDDCFSGLKNLKCIISPEVYPDNRCFSESGIEIFSCELDFGGKSLSETFDNSRIKRISFTKFSFKTGFSVKNCLYLKAVAAAGSIGGCFTGCENLEVINLNESFSGGSSTQYAFDGCKKIKSVNTQDWTAVEFGGYTFRDNYRISKLIFNKSLEKIKNSVFYNLIGCFEYNFSSHEKVPTLASTGSFYGYNPRMKIVVPESLYAEWVAATNWTAFEEFIYCKNSNGEYYKPTA